VTCVEVLARLAERPADVVLVDSTLTRPDPVGFVRRALGYAPGATVVLFGQEESQVAAAAVAAGARGVIRGNDPDLVTSVTKTLLLLCLPPRAALAAAGALASVAQAPVPGPATPVVVEHPVPADPPAPVVPAQRESESVPPRRPTLTERELQVLHGMADGKSNAEIGRDLFVSEDTVKTHARRLFRKLGARDRAHAVASGFRAGLVS
jgi:DNA-binding NarL/FixJ family response regulator